MAVPSQQHLLDDEIMPENQRPHAGAPPQGLGVTGIAPSAAPDDGEEGVHLSMFTEQALAVQITGMDVPDSHEGVGPLTIEVPSAAAYQFRLPFLSGRSSNCFRPFSSFLSIR